MNKEEAWGFVLRAAIVATIVIIVAVTLAIPFLRVKYIYGGDWRCLLADCRIMK